MKKQISHISPVQTAKLFATLYFLMSLPLVGIMAVVFSFSPDPKPALWLLILFPFLYLIIGFVFTVMGANFYNAAAKLVGGVEYTSMPLE